MLRRRLWALGLRYRLHAKGLPGKPDIVFRRQRLAVFVDGDFWHGRNWEKRRAALERGHNAPYWIGKIAYNIERDLRTNALLEQAGWKVLRLWETEVKRQAWAAADRVIQALRGEENDL
jgi:DNA mismatch endonuclease (patch repair protein)